MLEYILDCWICSCFRANTDVAVFREGILKVNFNKYFFILKYMYYIYIYIYVMLLYMYIHISISPLWPCQATNIYEIVNFFLSGFCNSSAIFESSVFLIFVLFWRIFWRAFRTRGFGILTRFTAPDVGRTGERNIEQAN